MPQDMHLSLINGDSTNGEKQRRQTRQVVLLHCFEITCGFIHNPRTLADVKMESLSE